MAEKTIGDRGLPARASGSDPVATRERKRYLAPAIDIYETEDGLILVGDLPGVKSEDLDLQVVDNVLTIKAMSSTTETAGATYREFELGEYFRQFQIDDEVDQGRITAELKNGVITVRLPKAKESQPKKIAVSLAP